MDNKTLPLPDRSNYQYGYQVAYRLASEKLAAARDLEQLCRKSGSKLESTGGKSTITLRYLNKIYHVSHPEINVSLADSNEAVPIKDKVLILHYINNAEGAPVTGNRITYKELPEGIIYASNFTKRTIRPLLKSFGNNPELLLKTVAMFDYQEAGYGDLALTINAFSHVPITLVLWRGDDEFAPEGSIIFDSTIPSYLSTEDITVLCENIVWRIVSSLKEETG
ncbi:MAG TPA: DUF3786 domain-containing protein [Dehalococcoidia bacterium]|nr:DUF3786 domain-containing protein [Dehalococcoidia bacterium]